MISSDMNDQLTLGGDQVSFDKRDCLYRDAKAIAYAILNVEYRVGTQTIAKIMKVTAPTIWREIVRIQPKLGFAIENGHRKSRPRQQALNVDRFLAQFFRVIEMQMKYYSTDDFTYEQAVDSIVNLAKTASDYLPKPLTENQRLYAKCHNLYERTHKKQVEAIAPENYLPVTISRKVSNIYAQRVDSDIILKEGHG